MTNLFKNIVRLPPPRTARSYSQLTPVYTTDEVEKTVASFEVELAKANEQLQYVCNHNATQQPEITRLRAELAKANARVKELEKELLDSATAIEENSNLNVLAGMMREVANAEQLRKEQE